MKKIILGQILLIICCVFYLIWWYRGYRPGVSVRRSSGLNGLLFMATAFFGMAGVAFSLSPVESVRMPRISPMTIVLAGVIGYVVLLIVTTRIFHRTVTTELLLITCWTVLEMTVINHLYSAEVLSDKGFAGMCVCIALAFAVSIVLYVAYYRMEEMKAFYAAMVPLVTEGVTMAILAEVVLAGR
jgi:hypothetical protein